MAERKAQCPKTPMGQMCPECLGSISCRLGKVRPASPASPTPAQEAAPVLEDDLAHEAEMNARATWREGADLDGSELDELDEPYEEEDCSRCRGDGRDPWNDYLLPCPECQGEQQP